METIRMRSKVDWWIGILLGCSVVVMLFSVWATSEDERLLTVVLSVPMSVMILWILFGTFYELQEDRVYIRCGPFVERIPYASIASVKLTTGMLSSMALSSKRIEIRQKGKGFFLGTTYISPIDRELFARELERRIGLKEVDLEL